MKIGDRVRIVKNTGAIGFDKYIGYITYVKDISGLQVSLYCEDYAEFWWLHSEIKLLNRKEKLKRIL